MDRKQTLWVIGQDDNNTIIKFIINNRKRDIRKKSKGRNQKKLMFEYFT